MVFSNVYERIQLGFIPMKLPIIDDVPLPHFNHQSYRKWANENTPHG
jgi:hypothetical protein